MDKIIIDEAMIQEEAMFLLDRELSHDEYLNVVYLMADGIHAVVQETIHQMVEHDAMLLRNREAEKVFPHFVVFFRNANNFQHELERTSAFKNEEDARAFINHESFIPELEEWRIVQVEVDGTEKEVIKINSQLP